jgi:SMC interacting uncharacterized protein involved in chromosome segregation
MSVNIFGIEFSGSYFENWNTKESLRLNLYYHVSKPLRCREEPLERYMSKLQPDEVELVRLRDILKDKIREATTELSGLRESLEHVDDAIKALLEHQAYLSGYANAEDDFDLQRSMEQAQRRKKKKKGDAAHSEARS